MQSEYVECGEPFGLLRAHTCKVVERAKKEKEQLLKELGEQINDSIKRTNSAYNAAIANRDYDDIVYDAKGNKYFEKFTKIRIPADSEHSQDYQLKGSAHMPLLQYFSIYAATMKTSRSTCCATILSMTKS